MPEFDIAAILEDSRRESICAENRQRFGLPELCPADDCSGCPAEADQSCPLVQDGP